MPDDHTRIPWRGKPADECPDGLRYKAIGNAMAVPVMRWIGRRIQQCLEPLNVEYVIKIAKHHKIHIINLANKSEIEDMHKMLDSGKYINVANVIERHAITPEKLGKTREEIQQFIAKQGEAP